jgi:uncharacterized protein HemX
LIAGPESAPYKVRKFVRRNRAGVAAAVMVFAALVVGLAGTVWQYRAASIERDLARAAENEQSRQRELAETARKAAEEQRAVADEQRDRALKAEAETKARADELELVSDFQAGMLAQIDPNKAGKWLSEDVITRFQRALIKANVPDAEQRTMGQSERYRCGPEVD